MNIFRSQDDVPAQSLGGAHRGRVCMCVFIGVSGVHRGECMRVYMSACVCTDVQKKKSSGPKKGIKWTVTTGRELAPNK